MLAYDLILRLLGTGHEVGVLPRRRLSWRHRSERLSQTDPRYSDRSFTECKAAFLAQSFLSGTDRYILWGHGGTGRSLRKALLGHGRQASHIIEIHPRRLGNRIDGAPVVPPERLPELPRHPLVVSVSGVGPRSEIRARLKAMGRVELRDYVCAA